MDIPENATLLRIHIGESDSFEGRPLHEAIVLKACESRLAGATVLRGATGFGRYSRLHASKILRLSDDLPLVVEMADAEEKIQAFLPPIETTAGDGLVILEKIRVAEYNGSPR